MSRTNLGLEQEKRGVEELVLVVVVVEVVVVVMVVIV